MQVFLLTAFLSVAQASPEPPVVNGTETSAYPAVGALLACDDNYGCGEFCSGTLINPGWVLTAAHCVAAINEDYAPYEIYFVIGDDLYERSGYWDYRLVSQAIEHPQYDDTYLQNDIGLVKLSGTIYSYDPMPLNTDAPGAAWAGTDLRYVGFGITGDNRQDSGVKRYADIPYWDADSQFIYGYDPRDNQNVCSGDSGGATIRMRWDGDYLAGVNSFIFDPYGGQPRCEGGAAASTRVDQYIDWIRGYCDIETSASSGGDDDSGDTDDGGGSTDDGGSSGSDDGGSTDDGGTTGGGHRPPKDSGDDEEWTCSSMPASSVGWFALLPFAALAFRRRRA